MVAGLKIGQNDIHYERQESSGGKKNSIASEMEEKSAAIPKNYYLGFNTGPTI